MAGLDVFTQMMIEAIMYVGIGLLLGCLIAVAVTPLVHNRAVRLTTRRLETALPQSMEEIQAGKDLLRAEFAIYARRLELINEWQKNKITSQLVELSKKSDVINWLKRDRDRLRMQVEASNSSLPPLSTMQAGPKSVPIPLYPNFPARSLWPAKFCTERHRPDPLAPTNVRFRE
jgi:hypothetical protein